MPELDSIIEYPLDFPVKIMGLNSSTFAPTMLQLVRRHAPDVDASTVETRPSREGKYVSLTVTIRAVSREQLDALYQALSDHPLVVMAL